MFLQTSAGRVPPSVPKRRYRSTHGATSAASRGYRYCWRVHTPPKAAVIIGCTAFVHVPPDIF
jgi:hypothetical protein